MSATTTTSRSSAAFPLCTAFLVRMALFLSCASMMAHHTVQGFSTLAKKGRVIQRNEKIGVFFRLHSSIKEQEGQIQQTVQVTEIGKKARQQQFWLDLRETAVTPTEALAFMQKALLQEDDQGVEHDNVDNVLINLVDKIIISEQDVSKLNVNMIEKMKSYDIELLHVASSDSDGNLPLFSIEGDKDCTNQMGQIVANSPSLSFNPLSAFDVTSLGQWFVMELDENVDQKSNQMQVSSLVELLSSTSSALISTGNQSSESEAPTELFLVGSKSSAKGSVTPLKFAVTCTDPNLLWTMDATLAEFHYVNSITSNVGATMTMSNSGIFIPLAGTPDPSQNSMSAVRDPNSPLLQTALVLPFDLNLWKTVMDLRQIGNSSDEDKEQENEHK